MKETVFVTNFEWEMVQNLTKLYHIEFKEEKTWTTIKILKKVQQKLEMYKNIFGS